MPGSSTRTMSLTNYENGMKKGQGFNSYTKDICIDDAVLFEYQLPLGTVPAPSPLKQQRSHVNGEKVAVQDHDGADHGSGVDGGENGAVVKAASTTSVPDEDHVALQRQQPSSLSSDGTPSSSANVDQIVTFSSRSIDDVSDVMDSLNISSSASIKYGTVRAGGSANYLNENKVNDSDLNYIVTCKVTNTCEHPRETMTFNPIPDLNPDEFSEVYGDCFIADFLEGGEFNAIISIKVQSQNNLSKVKVAAEMELAVGPPGLSVGSSQDYENNKSDVWKDTEISISVNWSGGGEVKPPNTNWDIVSVMKAANEFPNKVAKSSQRTSAVLMKYTSLRSFHEMNRRLSTPYKVLDYSCCELYTMDLFSSYMTYKQIWKLTTAMMKNPRSYKALEKSKDVPDPIQTDPKSLNMARRECRRAMTLILEETKLLATNPELAGVDANGDLREPVYMFPALLAKRLPRFDGNSIKDADGTYRNFTPEELATIGQHIFNPDLQFSDLVGNENPKKGRESHVFCSLLASPWDKLEYLTHVRVHGHQHSFFDHFRHRFPDFSHFSRDSERAISSIGFGTSGDGQKPDPKVACKCGLVNHVGRHDQEMEDIEEMYLSRTASLAESKGITKVVIGYLPGTFCIAALTLVTADGMPVCEWNMFDDRKKEERPRLEDVHFTPPGDGVPLHEDGKKVVKWVLAGFWGRADLVVERLGVIWRRI